jgi:HAD superfamily hydrolase (TIGR01549 family)
MFSRKIRMKYRHLIFDFDGVLVESNNIRSEGFRLLFKSYPENQVREVMSYIIANGGESRYKKIRYFFNTIRNEAISNNELQSFAENYSKLTKQKVIDGEPVKGAFDFLSAHHSQYDMAIVSSSDQEELREICKALKIDYFFLEILGSPATKISNISGLLSRKRWNRKSCLLVGDSTVDLEAAKANGIGFIGRNSGLVNWRLMNGVVSIDAFSQLIEYL